MQGPADCAHAEDAGKPGDSGYSNKTSEDFDVCCLCCSPASGLVKVTRAHPMESCFWTCRMCRDLVSAADTFSLVWSMICLPRRSTSLCSIAKTWQSWKNHSDIITRRTSQASFQREGGIFGLARAIVRPLRCLQFRISHMLSV